MLNKRLSLLVALAVAVTLVGVSSAEVAKKRMRLVSTIMMVIFLLCVLIYQKDAEAAPFRWGAEVAHFLNPDNNERIDTEVHVSNRRRGSGFTITNVQIIRRDNSADVTELPRDTCIFNAASTVLPFTAPLPFVLNPPDEVFSSISFSASRCINDSRKGSSSFNPATGNGGTAKDIAGYLLILSIDVSAPSQVVCEVINTIRTDNRKETFLGQTRKECIGNL